MKKLIFTLLVAILCVAQAKAAEPENLFVETFGNVSGEIDDSTPIDVSKFDNPDGWTFDNVFAGPECIIIRSGGSVTLPAVPSLTGNAAFYFDVMPIGDKIEEYFGQKTYTISINIGELSEDFIDPGISVANDYSMFDVTDKSHLTIKADQGCDIMLSNARIYYSANSNLGYYEFYGEKIVEYTPDPGNEYYPQEFYRPIDVIIKTPDLPHKIVVYTLDGSEPTRTSARYTDDTALHFDKTTTLAIGIIEYNGSFYKAKPVTYTFLDTNEPEIPASTVKINVKTGSLEDQLMELDRDFIEGLELHGTINGKDLAALCNTKGILSRLSYLNMKDVTFEYDDYCYKTASYAPEGGMGQSGVIYTYFSAENSEEYRSTGPMTGRYDIYSNNLANAFTAHPSLTRVELPDFLTTIGSAFAESKSLKMVTMSPNMTEIGSSAFSGCPIEIINIPESLETINDYAFSNTKITGDLNLPNLKYIGDFAFSRTKILSFVFNPGIEYIGEGAFAGTLLESVDMPNSPEVIRTNTFACSELKEAKFGEGLKRLETEIFGYYSPEVIELPQSLIELAADALPAKYIQSITPEDGIRYIGGVAYQVAEDREEYTIKDGTKSLAEGLFEWKPVKKVTVPNSVIIVGERAFSGSAIESLPVMEGVTEWPKELFYNCQNLARITIPEYVTNIGNSVFEGCSSLWQVKYNAIDADLLGFWGYRPPTVKVILGDKVERIPAGLFESNVNVTDLVLPRSVERIDTAAFASNRNLRSIYLPDGIKVIEPNTFYYCENLEEVHMPLNLERISNYAFSHCEALKTISIPEGTKILEEYAFFLTYNASTLYLPSTLISIGGSAFYQMGRNTEVKITSASIDPLIADDYYKDILYGVDVRDVAYIKVPNASVEDYKNHPQWGRFADVIIPIDEIAVSEEAASTSFSDMVDQDTDLSDTVVGNVYVTMSEDDGYDESDGSLVLCSTMGDDDADAIGGMTPGKSDLANRFNGLVVMVPSGQGTVIVDCLTIGSREVCVKIGDAEPQSFTKSDKGEIEVKYDVIDDTYVYIYASDVNAAARVASRAVSDANNCVKIYSVGVNPDPAGLNDAFTDSDSEITDYFTVEGIRLDSPTAPGIYIVKRADGSTSKILIK